MEENRFRHSRFDVTNLSREIDQSKTLLQGKFDSKIRIIEALIRNEIELTGIYTSLILLRMQLRLNYPDNGVLNNTLLNLPYRAQSILLLIRNTYYGSARVVCRQFFESLLIAKFAEYDQAVLQKWIAKDDVNPKDDFSNDISLSVDVFRQLERSHKKVTNLRLTWRSLCNMDHPTRFSQQFLRLPDAEDENEVKKVHLDTHFFGNVEYTLDLLFTLTAMNLHLVLAHYGRKATVGKWYFRYFEDAIEGDYQYERKLKRECKQLIKEYFKASKTPDGAIRMWKQNISEFRQSWASKMDSKGTLRDAIIS